MTFMVVPHGAAKPHQVHLHLPFLLFLGVVWTGITVWGTYLSAQHVDYWRANVSNEVLKLKIKYLISQIDQTRGYLDEVKTVDGQLRSLLKYKSGTSIIRNDPPTETDASGGPTQVDQYDISQLLQNQEIDLSWERIIDKVSSFKKEAKSRINSYEDLSVWIERQRRSFRATPRGWPTSGQLSSCYGMRLSPFSGLMEHHPGIDISGPVGTPVKATADGIVKMASWRSGYGNLVVLQHEFGFNTRYAHNSKLLVRVGDRVKRGQVLSLMGDTGRSSGPHCHYEVWHNNQRQNPLAFLKDSDPKTDAPLTQKPVKKSLDNQS